MNRTSFNCDFARKVELKSGHKYGIIATPPKEVKIKTNLKKFHFCLESFSAKQYLDMHIRFKHPEVALVPDNDPNEVCDSYLPTLVTLPPLEMPNIMQMTTVDDEETRDLKNGVHEPQTASSMSSPRSSGSYSGTEVRIGKRRGSEHCKLYNLEFKVQTIKPLDSRKETNTKNKSKKVAEMRGIPNKSIVLK